MQRILKHLSNENDCNSRTAIKLKYNRETNDDLKNTINSLMYTSLVSCLR